MKYVISLILLLTSLSLSAENYILTERSIVRKQPSLQGKVLGAIEKGDTIFSLSKDAEWTKIEYKRKHAYVSSKSLIKIEAPIVKKNSSIRSIANNKDSIILWVAGLFSCLFAFIITQIASKKPKSKTIFWISTLLSLLIYSAIIYVFYSYSSIMITLLSSVAPYIKYALIVCMQLVLFGLFYNLNARQRIMNYHSLYEWKITYFIIAVVSVILINYVLFITFADTHKGLVGYSVLIAPIILTVWLIIDASDRETTQPYGIILCITSIVNSIAAFFMGLMILMMTGVEFTLPTLLLVVLNQFNLLNIPSLKLSKIKIGFNKNIFSSKRETDLSDNSYLNQIEKLTTVHKAIKLGDCHGELIKKKANEEEEIKLISQLNDEEKALYSAYANLKKNVDQVTKELSIKPIHLQLSPGKLLPRFTSNTGDLIDSELLDIWHTLVKRYPTELHGIKHDAKDEVFLDIAEATLNETLQQALLYYVETLIELEACRIVIEEIELKKIAKEKSRQESKQKAQHKQITAQHKENQKPAAKLVIQKGVKARTEIVAEGEKRYEHSLTFRTGKWVDNNGNLWREYASGRFRPLRKFMIQN